MARVYHYTTAAGLDGIIRSRSFWATEYRFLNDASEFQFGFEVFREHFRNFTRDQDVKVQSAFFEAIEQRLERLVDADDQTLSRPCVFVASFSEQPDLHFTMEGL